MCGVNGLISLKQSNTTFLKEMISSMNDSLRHRGPDSFGDWCSQDGRVCFGHTRLSILDLSHAGSQPMKSVDNRFVISFNGEIYNHLKIRDLINSHTELRWRGHSDTETLINCISIIGFKETLQMIDGMFAFAVFDVKENKIFLARDRIGEKPLYYGWLGDFFIFTSELKSLESLKFLKPSINQEAIPAFLSNSYIPAPQTIYQDFYKLSPGEYIESNLASLKSNLVRPLKYWCLSDSLNEDRYYDQSLFQNSKEDIKNNLIESVNDQMISDVPLGCFLSGGIDSSLIASVLQSLSSDPISTFSIGFEEKKYDESKFAKEISQYLGTNHFETILTERDIMELIPTMPKVFDEPFGDSSQIPTYLVSRFARERVKVVLSGDGGDELFGGYNRYFFSNRYGKLATSTPSSIKNISIKILNLFKPEFLDAFEEKLNLRKFNTNNLANLQEKFVRALSSNTHDQLYDALTKSSIFKNFNNGASSFNLADYDLSSSEKMMVFDQLDYLPNDILVKVDRVAMANSLETRIPFLSKKMIESSWKIHKNFKIRGMKGKFIIREILKDYLPETLFDRPKQGFALPIDMWLRTSLKDWAGDMIAYGKNRHDDVVDFNVVESLFNSHCKNEKNFHSDLWNILMLISWLQVRDN